MSKIELTPSLYEQLFVFNSFTDKNMQENVRCLVEIAFLEGKRIVGKELVVTSIWSFVSGFMVGAITLTVLTIWIGG